MKKASCLLLASLTLLGCGKNQSGKTPEENVRPHATICLQPFDNYSQQEAEQLREVLENKFVEFFDADFEFEVLTNKHLTTDLMNDNKTRYRADKIIWSLSKEAWTKKS